MAPAQGETSTLSSPNFTLEEDEKKFQVKREDPDMVTISVSRAFAEEATLKAVSELRKELTQVRDDLKTSRQRTDALEEEIKELRKTSQERLDEMENEVKVAKQEAEDAKTVAQKLKTKMKSKFSALNDRMTAVEEALGQNQDVDDKGAAQEPEKAEPPSTQELGRRIYEKVFSKMDQVAAFQGSKRVRQSAAAVSFIKMGACFEMGWQREFSDRLTKACSAFKDCTRNQFLYFPGRLAFAKQHAFALAPMAQTSTEHGFELASTSDGLTNAEWELFFDFSTSNDSTKWKSAKIFYAGTFKCVELKDLHPDGLIYHSFLEDEYGFSFHSLIQAVVEAQVQKPLLRQEEIQTLILSGAVKMEFIGLKMVGFNEDLYRCVTAASDTAPSGTKRPHDSSASGSQVPKRTKRS